MPELHLHLELTDDELVALRYAAEQAGLKPSRFSRFLRAKQSTHCDQSSRKARTTLGRTTAHDLCARKQ